MKVMTGLQKKTTKAQSCRSRFERDESRQPRRHAASVTYVVYLVLAVLLAVGATAVYAQAGSGYDLTWNTVDTGGVTFAVGAGGYTLGGTAGQPDAAVWSGGGYTLVGGFWHVGVGGGTEVYLPIIVKP